MEKLKKLLSLAKASALKFWHSSDGYKTVAALWLSFIIDLLPEGMRQGLLYNFLNLVSYTLLVIGGAHKGIKLRRRGINNDK